MDLVDGEKIPRRPAAPRSSRHPPRGSFRVWDAFAARQSERGRGRARSGGRVLRRWPPGLGRRRRRTRRRPHRGPWTLLAGDDLARALGAPWSADGDHLTLRADAGVLVVFAGSPDGYWQPTGARDATPVSLCDAGDAPRWPLVPPGRRPRRARRPRGRRRGGRCPTAAAARSRSSAQPLVGGFAEVVALGPGVDGAADVRRRRRRGPRR